MTVSVEIANRSAYPVEEADVSALAREVLASEGIDDGELGVHFVGPEEMRRLKREHLDIDEPTDVLAFPIDERGSIPGGIPRQLGDAFVCPDVVGDKWRAPLVHALLHLVGHEHGAEMEERERMHRQ